MKKNKFLSLILTMLLVGCDNKVSYNGFYNKTEGNNDFTQVGNLTEADFQIDGVLDDEEWKTPNFEINYGGTDLVPAKVNAKLYFGDRGLTVGFSTLDTMVAASREYNNEHFVVDSDNVEFYIDCQNDKGAIAKSDDFTFLINPEEFAEMRIGTGSYWGPWSGVVDYAVKVDGTINNDSDTDVGWGCELFLPYQTFGFTKDSTIGIAFGCRDKTTNLKTSEWAGWIPDPQIIDTYVSIDKNGIKKEEVQEYKIAAGKFSYDSENKTYTSEATNSLAVHKTLTMRNGTYSAQMYLEKQGGDNGIIFQVKESETGLFWEGSGVRYFFFFINLNGDALLAKTNNGTWTHIKDSPCTIKYQDYNDLKVVIDNNKISCFVNGLKVIEHQEALFNSSIGVGLRSGTKGIKYRNVSVSDSLDVSDNRVELNGYTMVNGFFEYANDEQTLVRATANNSMMVNKNETLLDGTLTMRINPDRSSDNGIAFRIEENDKTTYWEDGVSYYFFFISMAGSGYLGRVNGGGQVWTNIGETPIENYNPDNEYTIKVELNGDNIKCYIDDKLYVDVNDSEIKGNKFGIRAGNSSAVFSFIETVK